MPGTGVHLLRKSRLVAHKTDAGGCGTEVRTVLALMVLEALDPRQSQGPVETDLSLTSPSSRLSAMLLPKPTARPAWPKPHVTGHPKSHGPCQEQRTGAKHPVIGEHKASSSGGPASIPLPGQCLQPRGTATFLP